MNIELSKNNHMVWGYNEIPWADRTDLYDKFFINYGRINAIPENFREACIITANEIAECARKNNKRPLIYYSGGMDSESIIAAFLEANIDFSIAHIKYVPGYNQHEYSYVKKFIKKYDLDLLEFSVNPIEFLSEEKLFSYAIRDNARLIETHLLTSITENIKKDFFPILDHPGTMLYRKNPNLKEISEWVWKDFEHLMFYYNHCKNENMNACPSFYHWSPEIILAFLLDPVTVDLVTNKTYGKITNRTSTLSMYKNAFPEYQFEERPKYGGFEYIPKTLINDLNRKLNSKTFYDRHSGQAYEYNELIRMLT